MRPVKFFEVTFEPHFEAKKVEADHELRALLKYQEAAANLAIFMSKNLLYAAPMM